MAFLRKAYAFLKRDKIEAMSYKASFLMQLLSVLTQSLTFFFVARLFDASGSMYLQRYGGEYFPFVLVGLAFSGYQTAAMNSLSSALSREQGTGTLEAIMMTPTQLETVMLAGSFWNLIWTSVKVAVYLVLGACLFGVNFSNVHFFSVCLSILLTLSSLAGLGLISAGFILVFKRGDPVGYIFNGISRLLGGVYFPVAVLPLGVQKISFLIPLTYALEAFRKTMLQGAAPHELGHEFLVLLIFSLSLFPAGYCFFKWAVNRAKKDGSLTFD